jgi:Zn-dependent protease
MSADMTVSFQPPERTSRDRDPGSWHWRDGLLLGRVRGFPLLLAPSWLIIAVLITISYGSIATDAVPGLSPTGGHLVAFAFAVLFAASILLHELGHAFVADALGLRVRKVVIFLLGGVSEIDPARRPRDEFLVAAAGPMVSFAIAVALWAVRPAVAAGSVADLLIWLLLWSNVSVAIFNVLPGLPLDGGRVLRAAVWGATRSRSAATLVGAWGGRILAAALLAGALALGLTGRGGPLLLPTSVVLAGFLWFSASASIGQARREANVDALEIGALIRPVVWAPAGTTLSDALEHARHYRVEAIVVTDAVGAPSAIVDDEQVSRLPSEHWPNVDVRDVAAPIAPSAVLGDALRGEDLLSAMRASPALSYLVVARDRQPLGVLRARDVARALDSTRKPRPNG